MANGPQTTTEEVVVAGNGEFYVPKPPRGNAEVTEVIRRFAELTCEGDVVDIYGVTYKSLGRALEEGFAPACAAEALAAACGKPLPSIIIRLIDDFAAKVTRLKMREDEKGYYLHSDDELYILEIKNRKKFSRWTYADGMAPGRLGVVGDFKEKVKDRLYDDGKPVEDLTVPVMRITVKAPAPAALGAALAGWSESRAEPDGYQTFVITPERIWERARNLPSWEAALANLNLGQWGIVQDAATFIKDKVALYRRVVLNSDSHGYFVQVKDPRFFENALARAGLRENLAVFKVIGNRCYVVLKSGKIPPEEFARALGQAGFDVENRAPEVLPPVKTQIPGWVWGAASAAAAALPVIFTVVSFLFKGDKGGGKSRR